MEMKWYLHKEHGFMTSKVLYLIEELERAIISAYKLPHSLATICFNEEDRGTVIKMPIILTETGVKSISSLVPIQDWKWYADDSDTLLGFCENNCIDVVNLNLCTGVDGYEVARVSATSLEEYLSTRDKSTRKTLKRVYEKEYKQLTWKTATKDDVEELRYLIVNHIAYWSEEGVHYQNIGMISSELYSELALGEYGFCRIGYLDGKAVCAYIWVKHDEIWHSVMAIRDREVTLQLGHCMQIDKVIQSVDKGTFCLGRSNDFPHKKKWATEVLHLGAIGEGYK